MSFSHCNCGSYGVSIDSTQYTFSNPFMSAHIVLGKLPEQQQYALINRMHDVFNSAWTEVIQPHLEQKHLENKAKKA